MLIFRALFVLLLGASAALAGPSGVARVIDGDTLEVSGQTVRLHGIDAPERDQTCRTEQGLAWPCGAWVTEQVRDLLDGHPVTCTALGTDRYGRTLARCDVAGADLAGLLVAQGLAFAYARYSAEYLATEARAQDADAGLWSGSLQTPQAFRGASLQPSPSACAIKGNISANGRLYHLPGDHWYDRTRIRPETGERWFCSEAEAKAAGWTRARG